MAGVYANVGLVDSWKGALGLPQTSKPTTCGLIAEDFTPANTLTYSALAWADVSYAVTVTSLWTVKLQQNGNSAIAVATITWNFPPSAAGLVLYGVGLYDATSQELFYTEQFPAPWIVPTGGGPLTWTFNLTFLDCSST